jgi:hypothetical protein
MAVYGQWLGEDSIDKLIFAAEAIAHPSLSVCGGRSRHEGRALKAVAPPKMKSHQFSAGDKLLRFLDSLWLCEIEPIK